MKQRGCGSRTEGGLYLCVDCSDKGQPVEYFLIDPVITWSGKNLRAPQLVESKLNKGVFNIVLGIGKEHYPFIPDFVEEGRLMGFSKRIPRDFPIDKLTPHKSRIFLVHPRAIPKFKYSVSKSVHCNVDKVHKCVHSLWSLSALHDLKGHEVEWKEKLAQVSTPSVNYAVPPPDSPKFSVEPEERFEYDSGIFMSLPIGHFEYVSKKKKMPKSLRERVEKTDWGLKVVGE